jgi:ATP-dependent Clp protease adaptor protein ClpS
VSPLAGTVDGERRRPVAEPAVPPGTKGGVMPTPDPRPPVASGGLGVLDVCDTTVSLDQDRPWQVLLWDDPVNTMAYVTRVLRVVFDFTKEQAAQIMLTAHTHGKAAVWSGGRDEAEAYVYQLHRHTLNATLEQT